MPGIFKNEEALSPEFLPEQAPGRESEIRALADALKPAAEGKTCRAVMLHGPPGTGKTTCAKIVLRDLLEHAVKTTGFYVNCWQTPTRVAVFSKIAEDIGDALPRRGIGGDEILSRVSEDLKKCGKTAVVFLDETDRLAHKDESTALYELARSGIFSVVMLTNEPSFLFRVDERTRSSLQPLEIEFARYSPKQLKDILLQRSKNAFLPNACGSEAIALCAAYASKNGGDARVAIQALYQAGRNAESRGADAIGKEDANKACGGENPSLQKRLSGLSETEEKIIEALRTAGGKMMAGELYGALEGMEERTLRNYLKLLEVKRVIQRTEVELQNGKTTRIKLLI